MTSDWVWIEFAACLAMMGLAGPEVCRSADALARKTGVSSSWVGLVLVAAVTSLPELVTGVTAVSLADAPDIAVGDVFGSCVFNLVILVVLDFLTREESLYRRARQAHVLTAGFTIVLIGFAGWSLMIREHASALSVAHVGVYTPVILILYMLAARSVFTHERAHPEEVLERVIESYPDATRRQIVLRYAVAGSVIVAAGMWLPFVGARIAETMDWNRTFVGSLLVAAVTSLPELVVTIAAVRIGALDMAIASLLGSNLFDMAVLAVDDLVYVKGPILSHVSPIHAVSAMSAVVMTGIVIMGLLYRPGTRVFRSVGWISIALLVMYLLNSYALFLHGE